jgi:hypothetical protein
VEVSSKYRYMPYKIAKKGSGYKVCKKQGGKCFSKKPLTKKKAIAQRAAIVLNSSYEGSNFFEKIIELTINEHL